MRTVFYLILFTCLNAFGQQEPMHPRVAEVQEKIRYDVREYLGSILPTGSYVVTVTLDPLRRGVSRSYDATNKEALPYMQIGGDDLQDEWDDPQASIYNLYSRIRSVKIQIDLSQKVDIQNIDQFKQKLIKDVGLIPGRDLIEIQRGLNFSMQESLSDQLLSLETILIFAFGLVLILGLYFQTRAIKTASLQLGKNNSDNSKNQTSMSAPSLSSQRMGPSVEQRSRELSVSNPILLREVIKTKLKELEKSKNFPLLTDMISLEDLSMTNQEAFSFLVYEFPLAMQKEILKRGRSRNWLEAFSSGSSASNDAVRCLESMIRLRQVEEDRMFQDFIIQMWRLGSQLEGFVSSMDRQFAISTLSRLPKLNALPIARTLFPGDWGKVLDSDKQGLFEHSQLERELNRALDLVPYYDFSSLGQFRTQKDLLSYIQTCNVQEEKDIYIMRGEGDILEQIRPPFYRFFELSKENMVDVFYKFSLEEWAIAIFNSARNYRDALESFISEKQRFLLTENLKTLNINNPQKTEVASIREKIALVVDEVRKTSKLKKQQHFEQEDLDALKAA